MTLPTPGGTDKEYFCNYCNGHFFGQEYKYFCDPMVNSLKSSLAEADKKIEFLSGVIDELKESKKEPPF